MFQLRKKKLTNSSFLFFFFFENIHSLCFILLFLIFSTESGSNSFEFYLKPIHRISPTFFANATRRTTWYVFEKSTHHSIHHLTFSRICSVSDDHVRLRSNSSLAVKSIPSESRETRSKSLSSEREPFPRPIERHLYHGEASPRFEMRRLAGR